MLPGQLVEGNMLCNSLTSKSAVSIKTAAGPSAPARFPSSVFTVKVKRSPSSFGDFNTTLAEKPKDVVCLSLPGMPTGVPGMEGEGTGTHKVYAINKDGTTATYATQ